MKSKPSNLFLLAAATLIGTSSTYALTWDPTNVPAAPVGGAGTWDASTTSNWSDGAVDNVWGNSPTAVAAFTGALGGAVTVDAGGVSVNAFNFTNTVGYTFSGGVISLVGTTPTLTATRIGGTSTADATAVNATFTNAITGTTLNTAGSGVSKLSAASITGAISLGGGGLILSGTNTAGSVAVGSNLLSIGSNSALAAGTAIGTSTNALILLANGVSTQANLTIAGGGGRFVLGSNADWKGNVTYTGTSGDISVNSGSTVGTISGNISMAGARIFFRNDGLPAFSSIYNTTVGGSGNVTASGIISGTFTSLQVGTTSNTTIVTLSNTASTYDAFTTINNGSLTISSIKNVGGGASSVGAVTTIAKGTINIGTNVTSTLKYTGTGDTTDRVINLAGTTAGAILDQSGTGLLKFTSAFTATGTGIKTLTLQGSASGAGEIAGAIIDNSGTNKTSMTKAGTGTWTLSGVNTYTGATLVSAGTLNVTGSLASAVTVNSGATLMGTGSTTGLVTLNNGSTITGGAGTGVGVDASNAFRTSSTLTTAATISVSGSDGLGTVGSHTIDVIQYTGIDPVVGNFSTTNYHSGATVTTGVAASGSNKKVTLGYTSAQRTWNSAASTWDRMVTTSWQEGDQLYGTADSVTFDDTGVGGGSARSVTLNSVVAPGSLTFNNTTGDYTVSGTGSIAGTNGLTKSGTGTVTLGTANTFTGQTSLTAGSLTLANTSALQNSTLNNTGGTLVFDSSVAANAFTFGGLTGSQAIALQNNAGSPAAIALTVGGNNASTAYSGTLSGAGSLTKIGTGALTLTGTSTYTGKTFLNGGVTQISADNNLGTAPGAAVADQLTFGGGSIQFGAPVTLAANRGIKLNAGTTFDTNGNAVTTDGVITGTGAFTKVGAGTLTLTKANTYTGVTSINAGTLQAGNTGATNARATLNGGNLTITNGVTYNIDGGLTFASNTNATVSAASGTASIQGFDVNNADIIVNTGVSASITSGIGLKTNTYGIRIDNTGDLAIAGVISGVGSVGSGVINNGTLVGTDQTALYKLGAGTLTLTGASTFTGSTGHIGATSVQDGLLKLSGGNDRLPAGSAVYLGATTNTNGKLVLDGINQTVTGLTTIGTGTTNAVVGGNATLSTLTVNNTNSYTFGGTIGGAGANENNLAFTKSGAGTMTLNGANTYTGNTTVSNGTLSLANASLADTSTVSIASGAILDLTHGATDTIDQLFIDGVQQAAGTYRSSTGSVGGTVLASLTGSGKLQVTTGPSNTFATWMGTYDFSAFPGADLTANGDADGDGISNLVEQVFGTAPNAATTGLTQVGASASTLTFKHPLNASLASDVTYSYQWSSDLVEWKASSVANTGGTTATISPGAPVAGVVTVTTTVSGATTAKVFVRIIANKAP